MNTLVYRITRIMFNNNPRKYFFKWIWNAANCLLIESVIVTCRWDRTRFDTGQRGNTISFTPRFVASRLFIYFNSIACFRCCQIEWTFDTVRSKPFNGREIIVNELHVSCTPPFPTVGYGLHEKLLRASKWVSEWSMQCDSFVEFIKIELIHANAALLLQTVCCVVILFRS